MSRPRLRTWMVVGALAFFVLPSYGLGAGTDQWAVADSLIVRLPPSAFPELPEVIRRELERRGCRVPQPLGELKANVVRGHFERRAETDWAVLSSTGGVSTILVFWNASTSRVDSLAPRQDRDCLQGVGSGQIGFSRKITTIGPRGMRRLYDTFGGGARPPVALPHDGIDDYFIGKASMVHFRHLGKWLELVGAD